jgi:hypothetical protein
MYQFNFKLTDDDYLEFNKQHLLSNPVHKKTVTWVRILLPLILTAMIFRILLRMQVEHTLALIIIAAVFLSSVVVMALPINSLNVFLLKMNIKAIKKQGKLPYGQDVSLRFDEDCLIETTKESETKMKYGSIERIAAGKNALYIYIGAVQAWIIPMSVFESAEQWNAFWAFIHNKAAEAKAVPRGRQPAE